jgi:hypothetical protein
VPGTGRTSTRPNPCLNPIFPCRCVGGVAKIGADGRGRCECCNVIVFVLICPPVIDPPFLLLPPLIWAVSANLQGRCYA